MNKSPAVARTTSLCLAEIGRDCKDEALLETRPCLRLNLSELDIFVMLLLVNAINLWGCQGFIFKVVVGAGEIESYPT